MKALRFLDPPGSSPVRRITRQIWDLPKDLYLDELDISTHLTKAGTLLGDSGTRSKDSSRVRIYATAEEHRACAHRIFTDAWRQVTGLARTICRPGAADGL